jgi:hypothetical protein
VLRKIDLVAKISSSALINAACLLLELLAAEDAVQLHEPVLPLLLRKIVALALQLKAVFLDYTLRRYVDTQLVDLQTIHLEVPENMFKNTLGDLCHIPFPAMVFVQLKMQFRPIVAMFQS